MGGTVELVAALEEVELHKEDESEDLTTNFGDEVASCGSTSTCGVWLARYFNPQISSSTYR